MQLQSRWLAISRWMLVHTVRRPGHTNNEVCADGSQVLCIGANWMHEASKAKQKEDDSIVLKAPHQRLWSWLVICDDRMNKKPSYS